MSTTSTTPSTSMARQPGRRSSTRSSSRRWSRSASPAQVRNVEWLPLGAFAYTREGVGDSQGMIELAVNKQGVLAGTYYNEATGVSRALKGMLDQDAAGGGGLRRRQEHRPGPGDGHPQPDARRGAGPVPLRHRRVVSGPAGAPPAVGGRGRRAVRGRQGVAFGKAGGTGAPGCAARAGPVARRRSRDFLSGPAGAAAGGRGGRRHFPGCAGRPDDPLEN